MLSLLVQCAKLRMLMAWCSTLGGAHSSLGETITLHVCTLTIHVPSHTLDVCTL